MTATAGPWIVLSVIIGAMLALDLLVLNRDAKPVRFRQAAAWSAVWVSLALAFGAFVAATRGGQAGCRTLLTHAWDECCPRVGAGTVPDCDHLLAWCVDDARLVPGWCPALETTRMRRT